MAFRSRILSGGLRPRGFVHGGILSVPRLKKCKAQSLTGANKKSIFNGKSRCSQTCKSDVRITAPAKINERYCVKPTLLVVTEKLPVQSKAAGSDGAVSAEDNKQRWTGWCNGRRGDGTEPAEWLRVVCGAVVQWHAVIDTLRMPLQAQRIELHRHHLYNVHTD